MNSVGKCKTISITCNLAQRNRNCRHRTPKYNVKVGRWMRTPKERVQPVISDSICSKAQLMWTVKCKLEDGRTAHLILRSRNDIWSVIKTTKTNNFKFLQHLSKNCDAHFSYLLATSANPPKRAILPSDRKQQNVRPFTWAEPSELATESAQNSHTNWGAENYEYSIFFVFKCVVGNRVGICKFSSQPRSMSLFARSIYIYIYVCVTLISRPNKCATRGQSTLIKCGFLSINIYRNVAVLNVWVNLWCKYKFECSLNYSIFIRKLSRAKL